jgi:serine/threonine-protein kinase
MATVYFAQRRGAAGFERTFAVKRMRPDLVHRREFVEMFLDEARLASRVDHVNVVRVLDVLDDENELFIVMEYIHGSSLDALLGVPVDPTIAAAVIVGALRGLHAAHEAVDENGAPLGIVHRDVSPQNVLVGVDGISRVGDFGVAKASGQLHSTRDGMTRGKARYMSPEQVRGLPVTCQSDVFAASILLWEALVGHGLFARETEAATLLALLQEPILAPGVLVPSLPEALDEVVMRGLEREPKNRWSTAAEMADALEKALPIATASAVGAWVAKHAGETLEKRTSTLAWIESQGEGVIGGGVLDPIAPAPPVIPPAIGAPLPLIRDRRVLALLAGVVLAVLVVPALMRAEPVPPLPPPSPSPLSVAVVPLAEPSEPSAAPSIASAPAPAAPHRKAPHRSLANKRCDPPYDVNSAGQKIFKVDCL